MLLGAAAVLGLLIAAVLYFQSAGFKPFKPPREEPIDVVKAYFKASYARDYQSAYRYISSRDRIVWSEKSYASQSGSFDGFALELARNLSASMEVWVIDGKRDPNRAQYKIGYRVPTADELSSLLFEWDPGKLNALPRLRQEQLLEALGKLKKNGKKIMIEGQETFDLVSDNDGWKILLDWASGIKVTLKTESPPSNEIDARFVQNELIVKKDEPFQIDLKIKSRHKQPVLARIIHHIEPRDMENHIDMIACGALRPLELQPGDTQEISTAYLIRDGLGMDKKIAITYEIELLPFPAARATDWKAHDTKTISTNTT